MHAVGECPLKKEKKIILKIMPTSNYKLDLKNVIIQSYRIVQKILKMSYNLELLTIMIPHTHPEPSKGQLQLCV